MSKETVPEPPTKDNPIPPFAFSCWYKKVVSMSDEKRYLTELIDKLNDYSNQIKSLRGDDVEICKQLIDILRSIVKIEDELREDCSMGVRFNVVRAQLQSLLEEIEQEVTYFLNTQASKEGQNSLEIKEGERLVYVYLFNAQGMALKTWQNLLLQSALIEHSVNRPIYAEKEQIEAVLRAKSNKEQHAYIEIVIKDDDILKTAKSGALQDQYGYVLLRVRQGSLRTENIRSFFHEDSEYSVSSDGILNVNSE